MGWKVWSQRGRSEGAESKGRIKGVEGWKDGGVEGWRGGGVEFVEG